MQKRLNRSTCRFAWHHVLDGGAADFPKRRGNVWALLGPFKSIGNLCCSRRCSVTVASAADEIIQSPIMSCSRQDHSVCQASANSILKISGHRRCSLSSAKGVVGLHSVGKVWLHCWYWVEIWNGILDDALEWGQNDLHMVQLMSLPAHRLICIWSSWCYCQPIDSFAYGPADVTASPSTHLHMVQLMSLPAHWLLPH